MARRHDAGGRYAREYRFGRESYAEYDRDAVHPSRRQPARSGFGQHADAVAAKGVETIGLRSEAQASCADDEHRALPGFAWRVREDPEVSDARAQRSRAR